MSPWFGSVSGFQKDTTFIAQVSTEPGWVSMWADSEAPSQDLYLKRQVLQNWEGVVLALAGWELLAKTNRTWNWTGCVLRANRPQEEVGGVPVL